MRQTASALIAAVLTAVPDPAAAQPARSVRQVDHVVISANNPSALFALLADTLRLPIAWPVASYGTFTSGGVSVGNLNVEIARASPGSDSTALRHSSAARFSGLAFEPARLDSALTTLAQRGAATGAPKPFTSARGNGLVDTLWVNATLPRLSDAGEHVFLCEYRAIPIHALRAALADSLKRRDGGSLGVLSVSSIVLGVGDTQADRDAWASLLAPARADAGGSVALGEGPALQLTFGTPREIRSLVLRVRSLDTAIAFLRSRGLLGVVAGDEARLLAERVGGLDIRLVAAAPAGSLR